MMHLLRTHYLYTRPRAFLAARPPPPLPSQRNPPRRTFAAKTLADEKIDGLQELYWTAKDEFEIASEETDKKTVYADEDRTAAREELQKLKSAFDAAVEGSPPEVGAEIRSRIGQRIRELDGAVTAMEARALED